MRLPTQTVIQMYQDNLFRIAFSICQNREDAEDVVQETFLRYHSGAVDFNDEMHIRAWLIRVTINQSKNMLRTFWHRNRTSLEDYMEQLNFSDTESQELFETVMKLPEKYRTAVNTCIAIVNFVEICMLHTSLSIYHSLYKSISGKPPLVSLFSRCR